jgi:hypothetical protein
MPDKAIIKVVNGTKKDQKINVLFYPNEYSMDKSNTYASTTVTGLSQPIIQFISGAASTLSMELFFDTSVKADGASDYTDVRDYTSTVANLINVDSELHAPPVCEFIWGPQGSGTQSFKGVMEKVTQKFTMFSSSGKPIRARLTVSFKSVKSITDQFAEIPRNSSDRTKQKMLKQGEHLWMLAEEEYQDPGMWREIANSNNIDNPRILQHGKPVAVPRLR